MKKENQKNSRDLKFKMKKQCDKNMVWEFTNQRKLTKSGFIDYFERKVFRTIRKYNMLPKNKIIKLKKDLKLNTQVLKSILEKKFKVKFVEQPNFSSNNLSQIAEETFSNILNGKFEGLSPDTKPFMPLYFLFDKEIELYAKLKGIKGKKRKQNKKIQQLFEKFIEKNPDLEHNIVNALNQINQIS